MALLAALAVSAAIGAAPASAAAPAAGAPPATASSAPAAQAQAGADQASPLPAPQAIPVERIFRAAEEVDGLLRKVGEASGADPAVAEIERHLADATLAAEALRASLEPERLHQASAREIGRVRQALAREALLLDDGQAVLGKRAERLADTARELQRERSTWQLTAESARAAQAPAAVLRRVAQVEAGLRAEEGRLRARQDRVLDLQARVSDLRVGVDGLSARVDEAEAALQRQLFEVESAPLWRALAAPDRAEALGGQFRQGLREVGGEVGEFLRAEQTGLWLHLLVVLLAGAALLALRGPVTALAAGDAALQGAVKVLAHPWPAALLLSLLAVGSLYSPLSPTLQDLLFLLVLGPLLRLLPELLPAPLRRPLYGLAALFALDKLTTLTPPRTLLTRLGVLLVTLVALVGLARGLRRKGWVRLLEGGAWPLAARAGAFAALGLLGASVISNLVGNATLAERLTHATLGGATLGVTLLGVLVVLEGALAGLLHLPAVERRPLVARHRALLLRRAGALLRLVAVLAWAWRSISDLGVDGPVAAAAAAVLELRLKVGGLDVTLGNVAAFAVTLALAWGLARTLRFVLDEGVFQEVALPRGVPAAVSTTLQYAILLMGVSWAALAAGMEMSRFSFLVGALGVGIGFGLQNVVNNFVSGLILLYERPVQVGDVVDVGAVSGEVTRIGVRSSTVRTFSGAEVIVPNATLISNEVTNWTLSDRRRRVTLAVGVAYGADPRQVIDLLLAAVVGRAGVLESPAPVAIFLRLGQSSLDFELRFWTADFDRWQALASEVLAEVYASLGRAGIEIPFPQQDLHLRSIDAAAAAALRGKGGGTG